MDESPPPDEGAGGDGGASEQVGGADPLRFDRWRKRTATGAVLTGIAIGLQQALDEPREEPAIVAEAPGEPEDPDALVVLRFDPDDPAGTVAVVRSPAPRGDRSPPAGA